MLVAFGALHSGSIGALHVGVPPPKACLLELDVAATQRRSSTPGAKTPLVGFRAGL